MSKGTNIQTTEPIYFIDSGGTNNKENVSEFNIHVIQNQCTFPDYDRIYILWNVMILYVIACQLYYKI